MRVLYFLNIILLIVVIVLGVVIFQLIGGDLAKEFETEKKVEYEKLYIEDKTLYVSYVDDEPVVITDKPVSVEYLADGTYKIQEEESVVKKMILLLVVLVFLHSLLDMDSEISNKNKDS